MIYSIFGGIVASAFRSEQKSNKEVHVMYSIDPTMSFGQVVAYYDEYVKNTRNKGKEPVSFFHFITGRY